MKREFNYYIYVDYSENLIGYLIISRENKSELLKRVVQFKHFKELRNKQLYLKKIKRIFERQKIESLIFKKRIVSIRDNLILFRDIVIFIKKNSDYELFISIDDRQYSSFVRLFSDLFNLNNLFFVRENELRKGSDEYALNLILDNLLNIERRSLKQI